MCWLHETMSFTKSEFELYKNKVKTSWLRRICKTNTSSFASRAHNLNIIALRNQVFKEHNCRDIKIQSLSTSKLYKASKFTKQKDYKSKLKLISNRSQTEGKNEAWFNLGYMTGVEYQPCLM